MVANPANDATPAMADLADALLDFQERPGRHAVALREPRVLFERITEVLVLASGRSVEGLPADPTAVDALRDAARFFVRTALLRPGADHFSLLGLSPGFDPATLREHYRMLIRMTHPDFASVAGVDWPADAATRINLANDVLSSDERREAYAQSLQRTRTAGGTAPAAARWAKDPWHAEPSGKRWPAVAAGLGVVALLAFWLWPSQTPQERLARLAAEAQEQELAAQQAAKEAQAARVAAATAATATLTPAVPTQTPPAGPVKTAQAAPSVTAAVATEPPAMPSRTTVQPTPPVPPSTLAQARPMPPSVPAPPRATDAPAPVGLAAAGAMLKLSQAISSPPERVAAARPSPPAQAAAALEGSARSSAPPAQAVAAQRTAATPTSASPHTAAAAPSPAVVVAAAPTPPAALQVAPAPVSATPSQGNVGAAAASAPIQTVATASPPATVPIPAPAPVGRALAAPAPVPAPVAERVAAVQPAPGPSLARPAGNSPRMSEVQPLLNQLLGTLQSGRGDGAVRLIDTMARQNGAGAGFSEAYERALGGARLLRIGQVQFAGRPAGDQLVVDGVLQLQLQASGEDAASASREFVLRAVFASRGGQAVLTQLSPAGASR